MILRSEIVLQMGYSIIEVSHSRAGRNPEMHLFFSDAYSLVDENSFVKNQIVY